MAHNTLPTRTLHMVYIALSAVLIAVCSWIAVPTVVPFTMQTFAILLTVSVLGGKRGTAAVLLYLLMGLIGIPVFSGFRAGPGVLFGATGGYMFGFLFTALIMWTFEKLFGGKLWAQIVSMVLGLLSCYVCGTIWFLLVYSKNTGAIGLGRVLGICVFPFLLPDALKLVFALLMSRKIKKAGVLTLAS